MKTYESSWQLRLCVRMKALKTILRKTIYNKMAGREKGSPEFKSFPCCWSNRIWREIPHKPHIMTFLTSSYNIFHKIGKTWVVLFSSHIFLSTRIFLSSSINKDVCCNKLVRLRNLIRYQKKCRNLFKHIFKLSWINSNNAFWL